MVVFKMSVAKYISVENYDVNIKFLQPNGPAAQFFRPSLQDICWIPIHDIIIVGFPPAPFLYKGERMV